METPKITGPLARFARIGALPSDTPDEALRKEVLVLSAGLITGLAIVWVVTYWALGLHLAAAIPFAYQVVSIINLAIFARTKRYRFFRLWELSLSLLLPFFLQLSLGGFVPSSGVILWSFTAPLGALLFYGRRQAVPWFVAFAGAVALAGALDPILANKSPEIPRAINILFFALNCLGVTGTCYVLLQYFVQERERYAAALAAERERSEILLLNVLPEPIATRLKAGENLIADGASDVGVLFADIAGFTPMAETMPPDDVVRLLDEIFSAFDRLAAEYRLEKIKTIGDAYMVASGLLEADPQHAENLARMALAMQNEIMTRSQDSRITLRIGIDIGPVVAGVIGRTKFIYDLWGDTVNTASRMESHGLPGAIHVTDRAADRLAGSFVLEDRGELDIKGKGRMHTYLLVDERSPATSRTPPRTNPSG
ncbi:MAG: adenylate/guanylate cyclase domain-containing protein [Actinomycetota bacterium]